LVLHLLRRAAVRDPRVAERYFDRDRPGVPRVDLRLVDRLVRHAYTTHVRELDALLWSAMAGSPRGGVSLTDEVAKKLREPERPASGNAEPSREDIEAALQRNGGNRSRAFRELGLTSRDALYRLIKKHGLL